MIRFGSPTEWSPASPEVQKRLLGIGPVKRSFAYKSIWTNDGTIKQVDLYCLLKSSYGSPNGFFMAARAQASGNLIEWHYVLQKPGVILQFIGSPRFLELWLQFDFQKDAEGLDWGSFSKSINDSILINRDVIVEQKSKLEKWDVFVNTFHRLVLLLGHYYSEFEKVKLKEPDPIPHVATKDQLKKYNYQIKRFTDAVIQKRNTGLIVRMLVPVALEALINLTILILAVPTIRKDDRLLEDSFRKPIDIRLKSLSLFCRGLKQDLDQGDERFKKVLRIMQSRNDLLHGNVEPHNNVIETVYFDGTIPFLPQETDIAVQMAKETLNGIDDAKVREDYGSIKGLRELISSALEPHVRKEYELALDNSQLGWRKDVRRLGVLFDDTLVQSVLISKKG
jgi:hypothetical protein